MAGRNSLELLKMSASTRGAALKLVSEGAPYAAADRVELAERKAREPKKRRQQKKAYAKLAKNLDSSAATGSQLALL